MSFKAVCVLMGEGVSGHVEFIPEGDATRVVGVVKGLTPGMHGFHVHALGDTTNGCASCGGHFNPLGATHGSPEDEVRHAGDLGNIMADDEGVAAIEIVDRMIPIGGPHSILGRAIVVHAGQDDLGKGGNDESLKTGNAGGRVACGVIALASE